VDKWTLSCVLALFGIGLLLGLAASPPLAAKRVQTIPLCAAQAFFSAIAMAVLIFTSMMSPHWCADWPCWVLWRRSLR
jgi:cell division protein FtsW